MGENNYSRDALKQYRLYDNLVCMGELTEMLYWDIDRFPLPICFDRRQEIHELAKRRRHIEEVAERFVRLYKIQFLIAKKYL